MLSCSISYSCRRCAVICPQLSSQLMLVPLSFFSLSLQLLVSSGAGRLCIIYSCSIITDFNVSLWVVVSFQLVGGGGVTRGVTPPPLKVKGGSGGHPWESFFKMYRKKGVLLGFFRIIIGFLIKTYQDHVKIMSCLYFYYINFLNFKRVITLFTFVETNTVSTLYKNIPKGAKAVK